MRKLQREVSKALLVLLQPLDKGYGLKYIDNIIDTPPLYLQTMCSIIEGNYTALIPSKLFQKLLAQQTK